MGTKELINNVLEWHEERQTNDSEKQIMYLTTEFGEFVGAYLKNDRLGMIDGIGDTMVVLIGISRCEFGVFTNEFEEAMNNNRWTSQPISSLIGRMNLVKSEMVDDVVYGSIRLAIEVLASISTKLGFTLEEALAYAYEQIKNRTGKTVDGVFIKDE